MIVLVSVSFGQKNKQALNLTNALVIGQLDNPEDRYSLEINLTEILSSNGIKTVPSLNILKLGADSEILASDSVAQVMAAQGIDTYVLVTVRGYDRKFKVSKNQADLNSAVRIGGLFDLYRMDIVSISFEFKFYREGKFVYGDIIKCGNISDRETVLKRLRKKVTKRVSKKWR
jgi:hypothetical protein